MKLDCQLVVKAPKEKVWEVITDYEHMVEHLSAITKVKIHERPTPQNDAAGNILGLKWTETRAMFGYNATETMLVTKCVVNDFYETRSENNGAISISKMYVKDQDENNSDDNKNQDDNATPATKTCIIGIFFDGEAHSVMDWMFADATKKALMQDLKDIKARAESMSK